MKENFQQNFEHLVDYLLPELTPYEASVYIFLLCNSHIKNRTDLIRIGKRTIARNFGKGARGDKTNVTHITKLLQGLETKNCIKIGDKNFQGTIYTVLLPEDIPLVREKIDITKDPKEEDYFTSQTKRREIFERDKWTCYYCREKVTLETATLDHLEPQFKGGKHTKDNLKTCCFTCNTIKSGKTFEEAAPYLLRSIQERRK